MRTPLRMQMRWPLGGAILAMLALSAAGHPLVAQAVSSGVVVLTNVQIVDVDGSRAGAHTVVVRGGKIDRIGGADVAAPEGATVIDGRGRWLAPGLIDVHTHISTVAAARRALASGVTTVRSASTPAFQDVALKALARQPNGPTIPDFFAAGVFVSPDLGESILADPRLTNLWGPDAVRSADALREVVNINADRGADWIKTRGTERAGLPETDPRKQTYTEADLRAVVEAAAARKLPVEVHAHGDEGAYAAVSAGARSIEHGTFLSDSTLALMKARGAFLVPTYVTVEDLTQPGGDYDDPVLTVRGRFMLPVLQETVRHAYRMGVKIATGVDTDYGPKSTSRVALEVERYAELGFSPRDALATATTNAAELLGIERSVGRVAEGMDADLILLDHNPLDDVRALQDVLVVIVNGRVGVNRLPFGLE